MSSLKRVLLSVTHLASGSLTLMHQLNRNPRVQFMPGESVIYDYTDLKAMTSLPHKFSSIAAMYAFELNFNYQLGSKNIFPHVHYLFVIRQPTPVLNLMISHGSHTQENAARYYCYRLRRICEIAKRVQQGMLLTFEDIQRDLATLKKFLSLKDDILPVNLDHLISTHNVVDKKTLDWCQDCYERHLFFLKNLPNVSRL